jgi:hypothetical protein
MKVITSLDLIGSLMIVFYNFVFLGSSVLAAFLEAFHAIDTEVQGGSTLAWVQWT